MIYIDTNILLRYLLADDKKQFEKAKHIIDENNIFILNEVIVEVIYVLNKIYKVSKSEIAKVLKAVLESNRIFVYSKEVIFKALHFYNLNIDPVDAILVAMDHVLDVKVFSFDKKLNSKLRVK